MKCRPCRSTDSALFDPTARILALNSARFDQAALIEA
jgi:hypothetical protein